MQDKVKLALLQEVHEIEWDDVSDNPNITADLARFTKDVLVSGETSWDEDEEFINVLLDYFDDDHVLWSAVVLT